MDERSSRSEATYEDRVVETRMRLRERYLAQERSGRSLGRGPLNRHAKPQMPIGQTLTKKWPVLDLGRHPGVQVADWRLQVGGACEAPLTLDWPAFMALPQVTDESDFHCVTAWSKLDMHWVGVQFAELAARALVQPEATHVMCHAYDGYSTNLSLSEALKPDVLLVHTWEGQPLPVEHGGPVRMITPQLYAWKGAKWIRAIEFLVGNREGYWEKLGYSNTADPWQDDRYSEHQI
ncbi:MAG TPA: molybdopterin-dependent oxidoreductase [Candidatus Xenobia bacterium]